MKLSRKLVSRLSWRSFKKATRGNVAMMFALGVIPMSAALGFGVDVGRVYLQESELQSALDSAALAAAQDYYGNSRADPTERLEAALEVADNYLKANMPAYREGDLVPNVELSISGDSRVVVTADASMPSYFSRLVGIKQYDIGALSEVIAGDRRRVEVALILDNTSSMFDQNRFNLMRAAAKDFTNSVFDRQIENGLIRIGVVPWTALVNIKVEDIDEPNADAVVPTSPPAAGGGLNPAPSIDNRLQYLRHQTGDDLGTTITSQNQLDNLFRPVEWRGCVRSANGEIALNGSRNVTKRLTDQAPADMRWPVAYLDPALAPKWYPTAYCPPSGGGGNGGNNNNQPNSGTQASFDRDTLAKPIAPLSLKYSLDEFSRDFFQPVSNNFNCQWRTKGLLNCWQGHNRGRRNAFVPVTQPCTNNGHNLNRTINACVSDPNEFAYNRNGGELCRSHRNIIPWDEHDVVLGPNLNCPAAMLPLSSNRAQIIRKLDELYPAPGGTQADIGLMWGLRLLSSRSEWRPFFGYSDEEAPLPFSNDNVRKIAILLTDGLNTSPEWYEGYYGCTRNNRQHLDDDKEDCWRSPNLQRLDTQALDNLMLDACDVMKTQYDVELFTIAVDISDSSAITKLRQCASDTTMAFNISAGELGDTFDSIAQFNLSLVR